MQELLQLVTAGNRDASIEKYVNGRTDIEKKAGTFGKLNVGQLATAAPKLYDAEPDRYRDSKAVLKRLRQDFSAKHRRNLRVMEKSTFLAVDDLTALAKKL
jgi:hypothetical protein